MKLLLELFVTFFKIGLIAFGGGYAVIPLLHREAVEYRKWITAEELTDIMAIAQTMPGIIFVNSATMVGYKVYRFWGSLIATTAGIAPTFILILIISVFFWGYTDNIFVNKAFTGVLMGVTAMIIYSLVKMWKTVIKSYFDILIVLLTVALLLVLKINAIWVILFTAAVGFVRNLIVYKSGENKK